MRVTVDLLKKHEACEDGVDWFNEHFPNGGTVDRIIKEIIKNDIEVPYNFVWWFYNHIQQDERLYKFCDVYDSGSVNWCHNVKTSTSVNHSDNIDTCKGVHWCTKVSKSTGISHSDGIIDSDGVILSRGVSSSNGISESSGISNCFGVSCSFGVVNSDGVSNGLFVANKPETFTLFNQLVTETRYTEVKIQLGKRLHNWKPEYDNWEGMPQEAIEYLKSLPEFDADIFKQVTGIDVNE